MNNYFLFLQMLKAAQRDYAAGIISVWTYLKVKDAVNAAGKVAA